MPVWGIRFFRTAKGRSQFLEEYDRQPAAVRAEFRATMNGLRDQPTIAGWSRPNGFDRLSGEYRELGKFRFKVRNVQYRPLGFFGPGQKEYTLLAWATERDDKFDPRGIRDTALRRRAMVLSDPGLADECDF